MCDRAAKRWRELAVGEIVACELNRVTGSDYRAIPNDSDPPDVLLESRSGGFPSIFAEVVSLAIDPVIRTDNDNKVFAENTLKCQLEELGVTGYQVSLMWHESSLRRGFRIPEIRYLAKVLTARLPEHSCTINGDDLYNISPALTEMIHYASITRLPTENVCVAAAQAFYVPRGADWIMAAVEKKTRKYAENAASRNWTLIIDGHYHLDDEQIQAYSTLVEGQNIQFAGLWAVSMGRASRLK